MTPGLRLNTAAAHTWAAVVSGTAWKRHALSDDGLLTAEYTRGPVIVWASTSLEGYFKFISEAVAKAPHTPAPTLEDWIEELNTAQVFERFQRAARGRVRHSVRWKTGRRPRRVQKLKALADLRHASFIADLWASADGQLPIWQGIRGRPASKLSKDRRAIRRDISDERYSDRLRALAPSLLQDSITGIDLDQVEWWAFWGVVLRRNHGGPSQRRRAYLGPINYPQSRPPRPVQPDGSMAAYFTLTGKRAELAALLIHWKSRRPTLGEILAAFQRAEYRAHLAQRVKPAPRRGRVRRPLYARPRPPCAPLAPPVS